MSFDPVEGVHYIFDRYAFLNKILEDGKNDLRVSETSDKADFSRAFGIARAMYHPDRQARAGEEMKRAAEQKTWLIADCERFLLNPELKSFYDEKLAEFREKKPRLVSTTGQAIVSLGETFFDIGALLSDEIVDTSGFEKQLKAMTQHDEKRLPQMKALYAAMPDNAQIKSLYRDALTQELVYLTLLEDAAWAKVGYMNRKEKPEGFLLRAADYGKRLDEDLQKTAARDIDASIERHGAVARIGMAKTPLALDAAEGTEFAPAQGGELTGPEKHKRLLDEFKKTAHKNFEIRAGYVREVGKRKQDVLEELTLLTPVETLHPEAAGQKVFDFILVNPEEDGRQRALFRMEMDVTTGSATIGESYDADTTLDGLKQKGFTRGAFAVTRNPEISDIMLEIASVSERFLNDRQQRDAKPAQDAPAVPKAPKPPAP